MASRPVLEAMAAGMEAQHAPVGASAAGGTAAADARVARAAELRRLLSPPELLRADGSIEQTFFKPERVREDGWTDGERARVSETWKRDASARPLSLSLLFHRSSS